MLLRRHFAKYYLKYLHLFIIGLAALAFVSVIQLRIPLRMGEIVGYFTDREAIVAGDAYAFVMPRIYEIMIIVGCMFLGRIIWRYFIMGTARRIEEDLRNEMFTHGTKLSKEFYNNAKTGGLMALFTNDLDSVVRYYGWGLLTLVDGLLLGTLVLIEMFGISGTLTAMALIPLVGTAIGVIFIVTVMRKKFKERQQAVEELSDFSQENFSGISVVKAYVKESDQKAKFNFKAGNIFQKDMVFVKYSITLNILMGFIVTAIVTVILLTGSIMIINNQQNPGINNLDEGVLTSYVLFFFNLLWPVMAMVNFFLIRAQGAASASRIGDFLDHPIAVKDTNPNYNIPPLTGQISFNHLTFSYPDGEKPVIEDVSFTIKAGQMVGILGKTGSGKSSFVELLLRMYNIEPNMISLDGFDINAIPLAQLRDAIGYVPQDNFLYSDTITNNIGFSYENPEPDIVENAAKLADVYENIVDFKEGFETVLGERGVTVSGGQKQRISIARALAKDPQILILDDSVSAVDTKTEEAIINNLMAVRQGKTTLIIAHRISTVKRLDLIVLLDKGHLVGIGTHDELMATNPIYQDMVKRQELEIYVEGDL